MAKVISKKTETKIKLGVNGFEKEILKKRVEVLKTYKIYIGGKFPRTESGRYYMATNSNSEKLANMCLSSRKDFRDAVVAARKAFGDWGTRYAFNRAQILYRVAEMLEGRKAQFVDELIKQDIPRKQAEEEVNLSVDRLIYYAGWCDKFQQVFSAVNPVGCPHFNFSTPEPTGVVSVIAPQNSSLLGLVSVIAPVLAGGNTCVVLASYSRPLCAVSFAEVLNSSDVPGGTVNILTGNPTELLSWFSNHMDVNAVIYCENDNEGSHKTIRENASLNMKRAVFYAGTNWMNENAQSPYMIMDTQEIKTTWHPIEGIGGAGGGY